MQGSIALRNEPKAMAETPAIEFIYTLVVSNTIEAVTADPTLYVQKIFIYPVKAISNLPDDNPPNVGVITPNSAFVLVGKSGVFADVNVNLTNQGSVAIATAASHGFRPGMSVSHSGANLAAYNVFKPIFDVTRDTYKYQMASDPGGPPNGQAVARRLQVTPDRLEPTDLPIVYQLPLGMKMRLADVIVQGTATDGVLIQAW